MFIDAQKPLMPKGVEHQEFRTPRDSILRAQKPLMPKGVEHLDLLAAIRDLEGAQKPLMPKGVEHYQWSYWLTGCSGAETFDAERR